MKCNNCNGEWTPPPGKSITVCPFCQEKIIAEKSSDWQFFDNTKELLAYIAIEYGNDALFGRKYFSDHTLPSMPQGQKNLVKQAFECGAIKIIQDNMSSDQARKETAVKQAVSKLVDTYASAKEAAERVVWEFIDAIGWGMLEPKDQYGQQNRTSSQEQNGNTINSLPPSAGLSSLLKLAAIGLQNEDWQEAEDYYKDVLKQSPEYAPAWIGRLCVDLKLSEEGKLAVFADPNKLSRHRFFQTAMRFADPTIKARLDGYIQTIKDRIEAEKKAADAEAERKRKLAEEATRKKRVQDAFDSAYRIIDNAQNPDDYRKAITAFGSIDSNYKDINNKIKERIAECEKKIATLEAEQKSAAVEAERQRKIAEEADRKKRVQNAFNSACKTMNNAKNTNDYQKAIIAFNSINSNNQEIENLIKSKVAECETKKEVAHKKQVQDAFNSACRIIHNAKTTNDYQRAITSFSRIDSNYQDINSQIKSRIAECEKKKASIETAFRQKYGVLLDRLSSEGKAKAGERRKAAQAQLDEENAKAKSAVETKCAQLQQQYDADYKVWQEKVLELKALYEIAKKNCEEEANKLKAQSEMWKSQKLCPHDGGTLKGLRSKKCTVCGKAPSEPIAIHPAPTQPKYPPEPQKPQMPMFTPCKLETESALPPDVVATIKDELVFVKLGGIDWRVLTVENNKALLISQKILETRPYNTGLQDMTWEWCTLRRYLNSDFYNKLGVAKTTIAEIRNDNSKNHWYSTSGGNATVDKVFLLSLDELVKYFGDSGDLQKKKRYGWEDSKFVLKLDGYCLHDQYYNERIAKDGAGRACWWWLRSSGYDGYYATYVRNDGHVYVLGIDVNNDGGGVRPALWLNL